MRIHFTSVSRPKRVAKSLRKELSSLGIAVSLPSCQNLAAELYGYSHWHELESHIGREAASPDDEVCDAEVVEARRTFQIGVLARRHSKQLLFNAEAVIAAVRPTAAAGPSPCRRRAIALERDGYSGAAMTDVVGAVPVPVTAVVLVSDAGVFRLWWLDTDAREAADIWERIDTGRARNDGAHSDTFLRMFGVLPASDRFPAFAMPPEAELAVAREAIMRNVDRESFEIARQSPGDFSNLYETYLVSGPGAREFARRHPELAGSLLRAVRGESREAERRRDARQTLEAVIAGLAGLGPEAAAKAADAVEAMRGLPWASRHFLFDFGPPLAVLARLPRKRVPSSAEEADAFRRACSMTSLFAPWMERDAGARSIADFVLSAGEGRWTETLAVMDDTVARATANVFARGGTIRALTGVAFERSDRKAGLFGHFGDVLNAFVREVALPALMSSDLEAAFVYQLPERSSGAIGHEVERHCLRVAAPLLAEGLTFDEAVALAENWFVSRSATAWRRPLTKDLTELNASYARLDAWRPFLRPQYRGLSMSDLSDTFDRGRTNAA